MANEESDKVVEITMDGNKPKATPDSVPVRRGIQKVKWCAAFPFTITIEGENISSGPGGSGCENTAKSGVFNQPVDTKVPYTIAANGTVEDPEVDIKP